MSEIQEFLDAVQQDESLQEQLSHAPNRQIAISLAVEFGEKLGYNFTPQSLEAVFQSKLNQPETDTGSCPKCGWYKWCDVVDTVFPLYCTPHPVSAHDEIPSPETCSSKDKLSLVSLER